MQRSRYRAFQAKVKQKTLRQGQARHVQESLGGREKLARREFGGRHPG